MTLLERLRAAAHPQPRRRARGTGRPPRTPALERGLPRAVPATTARPTAEEAGRALIGCCHRGVTRGTSRRYRGAPVAPGLTRRRRVREGRGLGPGQPVRERPRGGVLGRQLRARRPASDAEVGVVPADAGLGARVVGRRAEVLDLGRVLSAQKPRANDAGAQNRSGSSADASTATTRPSVGDPGRMSTATMNARPVDDPHELALGRVPLEVEAADDAPRRARLVDLDEPRRQAPAQRLERRPTWAISANQPRSSPYRRGADDRGPRRIEVSSTVNGTVATSSPGRRPRPAPGPVMNAASSEARKATASAISSGGPEAAQRRPLGDLRLERLGEVLGELGEHEARGDGVDGDPARGELAGGRLGQADQPGLRGAVVRLAHLAGLAGHARDVDDPPAARLEHRPGAPP